MSPADVRLHPEAADEAEEAYRWYRERSQTAAMAFRTRLRQSIVLIAEAPERHRRYLHGTRRILLPRFPYLVVYRIADDGIEVVAVAHGRRRPGYWRDR